MTKRETARPVSRPPVKPMVGSKLPSKKPLAAKSVEHEGSVGVAAGNGKDRHSAGDEFEEF